MWQQGLSAQTWRGWASEILLTNKTPLTKTNSQFSTPPNKVTELSITSRKLVNRGKTLGVSCFPAPPACLCQPLRAVWPQAGRAASPQGLCLMEKDLSPWASA